MLGASNLVVNRLKTRQQFQATLNAPVVAKSTHFAMHRLVVSPQSRDLIAQFSPEYPFSSNSMNFGAMVPKRWAKRAVTRNTLKRQIYAVAASLGHQFSCAAYLVRLRAEFSRQLFASASSEALKAAARAELANLIKTGFEAK